MNSVNVDLREKGLSGEETPIRAVRRQPVTYINPTQKWEKMRRKKKKKNLDDILHEIFMFAQLNKANINE